ncbi:MAG: long-chain-fatty-acid--CoA ligase [Acidimicrobiia bacterium]
MLRDIAFHDVDPDRVREYTAAGFWTDDTFGSLLVDGLRARPELPVVFHSATRPFRGKASDLADLAGRVASGLVARGVTPGEPVALQMPNWFETAAALVAIGLVGAVPVPIVHFYGAKELGFILGQSRARVLLTADRFGHVDMIANLEQVRPGLDALEEVFVLGDTPAGTAPFRDLTEHDRLGEPVRVDPAEPGLVMYTSGTTADPKGVVHAHRSICFETKQLAQLMSTEMEAILVGAPIAHGIGMLSGVLLPIWKGDPIHVIDAWDPGRVLQIMVEEQIASGSGATIFLTSLLDHPDFSPAHAALMPAAGLGGSSVPPAVGERAAALGIATYRSYGSSEHPSITGCHWSDPYDKRVHTDGRPMLGCEIRLVDGDGHDVAAGTPGEIWSRGPDCFLGYTDPRQTRAAFAGADWYRTGDVGVLDDDGYLTIVDRKTDIIIRGGANVSALEIEELVLRMPGVAEVAVVAAPDDRLGEHGCAFVRPRPGAPAPTLEDMRTHLEASGLARPKWPEDVRVVDDFPRTASGKVQKFVLRQQLRDEAR